ncbi:DUF3086 domain-containing protein [Coleofasciculus sp. E1-EBD-02]|uniref:DUF3086 domain-containing protein n=1 Tax=Coleofasciculus sp. E1-EBD-02 TaxID=3068481 RepID=UPI0032FC0CC8
MNSDEPQTQESNLEQQPILEGFEENSLEQKPETESSKPLTDSSDQSDVSQSQAGNVNAVDLPGSDDNQMTPSRDQQETVANLTQTIADLERQEQQLRQKIAQLQASQNQILSDQLTKTQATIQQMLQEGLSELEQRKQALLISVEQLERRRERIRTEMRTTFAGVSQELAIRVQGFKDYLVGSLQDLVVAAEELELAEPTAEFSKPRMDEPQPPVSSPTPKFAEQAFQDQIQQIRDIIDQYRKMPDYYGPPWQLRRTFEPIHAERVSNWFFSQGGRGAIRTIGSRLQNILVASAVMSVMRTLYGDRLRTLVLANTPERLGEWRRGLQDCLGIARSDFGPERGVVLFEEPSALVQKADRLMTQKQLPLIIVDETEDQISLSILQFPLWLAFAPDPQQLSNY